MFWSRKRKWFLCTLVPEGDHLTVFQWGKKKMTRAKMVEEVSEVMKGYPDLFIVFSAKKVMQAGICNAWEVRSPEKGRSSILTDLSSAGQGGDVKSKKVMN